MATITAGEILDRMKKNLGVPWQENSARDTYKSGGPATEVTGIATTVMSTFDQVKRAQAQGLNFILSHETTYWNDRDIVTDLANDPTYKIKSEFCAKNNIVIHRFHDNLHAMRPDFNFQALARDTGWSQYETAPNSRRFTLPETTLGALAADVAKRLGTKALRIVGDPNARVSKAQMSVGYGMPRAAGDVDVIMSGEAQETDGAIDNTEYVLDAASLGVAKGQIILGHCVSEEPGMEDCTEWLKKFITEVPVRLVRAGEPYWPK
jgi:putative NIF3 family GTP cyclohydrolase 1 type 2